MSQSYLSMHRCSLQAAFPSAHPGLRLVIRAERSGVEGSSHFGRTAALHFQKTKKCAAEATHRKTRAPLSPNRFHAPSRNRAPEGACVFTKTQNPGLGFDIYRCMNQKRESVWHIQHITMPRRFQAQLKPSPLGKVSAQPTDEVSARRRI